MTIEQKAEALWNEYWRLMVAPYSTGPAQPAFAALNEGYRKKWCSLVEVVESMKE